LQVTRSGPNFARIIAAAIAELVDDHRIVRFDPRPIMMKLFGVLRDARRIGGADDRQHWIATTAPRPREQANFHDARQISRVGVVIEPHRWNASFCKKACLPRESRGHRLPSCVRPHIPARVWMNWVQIEPVSRNYPVLTVRRAAV